MRVSVCVGGVCLTGILDWSVEFVVTAHIEMAQEHVKRQVAAATVATTVLFLYQVTRILASAPTSVPAPQYQLDPTFPALNS